MRTLPLALLALVACGPADAPGDLRPTLRVAGSETLTTALMPALAATHESSVGTMGFTIEGGGSGDGLRALLDGRADLAAVTRERTFAEEDQAQTNGYSFDDDGALHVIGVDVVAVSVHPASLVGSLTYDQVIGIFCKGTIDNWSFLGQDAMPIRVMARDPASGTRALFEDFFCGPAGLGDHVEVAGINDIRLALANDPATVSFVSMTESYGKVLGLRPDPRGPALLPSQQNIIRGAYPLYHDVALYSPGPPSGLAADFLVWIASPSGQEVVDEARFVPLFLRPERLNDPRPLRETVHFLQGSEEPTLRSKARLQLLVDELGERAGEYSHLILEGYADSQEPNAETLSEDRAEAVRDLLAEQLTGVYFEIIPRGATRPIAPNETPYGRERNRRVQIYLAEEEGDFAEQVPEMAPKDDE